MLSVGIYGAGHCGDVEDRGRFATMSELIQLAKKEPSAFYYLANYLLSNEVEILADGPGVADGQDAEKFKIRVLGDGHAEDAALIFTSQRALGLGAGALAIERDNLGNYPTVTANGREAFMILWSNGIKSAVVNYGDVSSILLDGEDIEILADGRTPEFTSREEYLPQEPQFVPAARSAE